MVGDVLSDVFRCGLFQYSLCRVVLMVGWCVADGVRRIALSVLALSSRFDGRTFPARL